MKFDEYAEGCPWLYEGTCMSLFYWNGVTGGFRHCDEDCCAPYHFIKKWMDGHPSRNPTNEKEAP